MLQLLADLLDYPLRIDTATMDFIVAVRTPLATKLLTSATGLGSATAAVCFVGFCYLAGTGSSDTVWSRWRYRVSS